MKFRILNRFGSLLDNLTVSLPNNHLQNEWTNLQNCQNLKFLATKLKYDSLLCFHLMIYFEIND